MIFLSLGPRECERVRSNATTLPPGSFVPNCTADGKFEDKQCDRGHCWCVGRYTGIEIEGTRKTRGQGEVTCGMTKFVLLCDSPIFNRMK